jgi:hypothetical protein
LGLRAARSAAAAAHDIGLRIEGLGDGPAQFFPTSRIDVDEIASIHPARLRHRVRRWKISKAEVVQSETTANESAVSFRGLGSGREAPRDGSSGGKLAIQSDASPPIRVTIPDAGRRTRRLIESSSGRTRSRRATLGGATLTLPRAGRLAAFGAGPSSTALPARFEGRAPAAFFSPAEVQIYSVWSPRFRVQVDPQPSNYESGGRTFESFRARQKPKQNQKNLRGRNDAMQSEIICMAAAWQQSQRSFGATWAWSGFERSDHNRRQPLRYCGSGGLNGLATG